MNDRIASLVARIRALQEELEEEFEERRSIFKYRLERGRIVFEREV